MSEVDKKKVILDLHDSLSEKGVLELVPRLCEVYEKLQNEEDVSDEELRSAVRDLKNLFHKHRSFDN